MVAVPSVDPTSPGPLTSNLRSTPNTFGAGIGRAVAGVGGAIAQAASDQADIELKKLKEDNTREAKLAVIAYKQQVKELRNQYDALKGENAVKAEAEFSAKISESRTEISGAISNQNVLDLFTLNSALDEVNAQDILSRSARQQREVAEEDVSNAVIAEGMQDAVVNYTDDALLSQALSDVAVEVRLRGERLGKDASVIDSEVEAATSAAARDSIVAAIKGRQTARAQELFDVFSKGVLEGDDLVEVGALVQEATDLEGAQEHASVVASLAMQDDGTINLDTAFGLLAETPGLKGKQLEDAKIELRKLVTESNAIVSQRRETVESDLNQHLAQGGSLDEWTSQNPEAWADLQKDSARMKRIQANREVSAAQTVFAGVSDNTTWSRVMRLTSGELATLNLDNYKGVLTQAEFNSLVKAQSSAIDSAEGGVQTSSQKRAVITNARGVMDRTINTIPGFADLETEESASLKVLLERQMDEFVQQFTNIGKEPSPDELNKEASRLVLDVEAGITERTIVFGIPWFDKVDFEGISAGGNRLTPEQRKSAVVPLENMTELQKFEWSQRFSNAGIKPTKALIEQLGGAIAMNDQERIDILLSIKVKEEEE